MRINLVYTNGKELLHRYSWYRCNVSYSTYSKRKGRNRLVPSNGDFKLIRDNISAILYYMIGQRFRQENFGSKLWQCIEEPNSQALSFIIKEFLKQAIGAWEQRITFQSITVTRVDAKIHIEVAYVVNGTNSSQYLDITYDHSDNSLNTQ